MSPRREVLAEGVELWLGDCLEVLPTLGRFDAVVTDPPYGIGFVHSGKGGKLARSTSFGGIAIAGDNKPFDPSPFLGFETVVLWGGNHFASRLPSSAGWLIWDKRDGVCSNDQADCEIAWTNQPRPARVIRHLWNGISMPVNLRPSLTAATPVVPEPMKGCKQLSILDDEAAA